MIIKCRNEDSWYIYDEAIEIEYGINRKGMENTIIFRDLRTGLPKRAKFDSIAYICSDEGKTLEKLVFKE